MGEVLNQCGRPPRDGNTNETTGGRNPAAHESACQRDAQVGTNPLPPRPMLADTDWKTDGGRAPKAPAHRSEGRYASCWRATQTKTVETKRIGPVVRGHTRTTTTARYGIAPPGAAAPAARRRVPRSGTKQGRAARPWASHGAARGTAHRPSLLHGERAGTCSDPIGAPTTVPL